MRRKFDDSKPIYIQVKELIEDQIVNGTIKVGDRAPSTNELAHFYQINPATARQGINELVMEGILEKRRGVGMFITEEGKRNLLQKRKDQFHEKFIMPLKSEANQLNISKDQLIEMIMKEGD